MANFISSFGIVMLSSSTAGRYEQIYTVMTHKGKIEILFSLQGVVFVVVIAKAP